MWKADSPEYTPPELPGACDFREGPIGAGCSIISGLAVVIFQLLFMGPPSFSQADFWEQERCRWKRAIREFR
jgi:DNA-binding helix-hairpin-helix protein with protein kinase domain